MSGPPAFLWLLVLCVPQLAKASISSGVPRGFVKMSNHRLYFKYFKTRATYFEALTKCSEVGGKLAEPWREEPTKTLAKEIIKGPKANVWIGGRKKDDLWLWESKNKSLMTPGIWKHGRPVPNEGNNCLTIQNISWVDRQCSDRLNFLCSFDPIGLNNDNQPKREIAFDINEKNNKEESNDGKINDEINDHFETMNKTLNNIETSIIEEINSRFESLEKTLTHQVQKGFFMPKPKIIRTAMESSSDKVTLTCSLDNDRAKNDLEKGAEYSFYMDGLMMNKYGVTVPGIYQSDNVLHLHTNKETTKGSYKCEVKKNGMVSAKSDAEVVG